MKEIYNGDNNSNGNLKHDAFLYVTGAIGLHWGKVHSSSLKTTRVYA